jgi:outer membrane protein assembly factor BamB
MQSDGSKDETVPLDECRYYKRVRASFTTTRWGFVLIMLVTGTSLPRLAQTNRATGRPVPAPPLAYEAAWSETIETSGPLVLAVGSSLVFVSGGTHPLAARAFDDGHEVWTQAITPGAPPVAGGDALFVLSSGRLTALDQATGHIAWGQDLPAPTAGPWWRDGVVMVASGEALRVYRADTGAESWRIPLPALPIAPPAVDGNRLFAVLANQTLVSVDMTTHAQVWSLALPTRPNGLLAAHSGLYFGGADGVLYGYSQDHGRLLWPARHVPAVGSPAADDRHVYFALLDNTADAFDPKGGALRWRLPLGSRPLPEIRVIDAQLLVPLLTGALATFPVRDGRPAGKVPPPAQPEASSCRLEAFGATADGGLVFRVTVDYASDARVLTASRRVLGKK